MRVKIGDDWYDSNERPIMIEISEGEQEQIGNIDRAKAPKGRFAIYPLEAFETTVDLMEWICEGGEDGDPEPEERTIDAGDNPYQHHLFTA